MNSSSLSFLSPYSIFLSANSTLEMSPNTRAFSVLFHTLFGSLLSLFSMSYANSSELSEGIQEPCDKKSSNLSFWYSFAIAYAFSATAFMYYCVPWSQLKRKKKIQAEFPVGEKLQLTLLEKENQEISIILDRLISTKSFKELCKATDYFSVDKVIGSGKTGMMYKAKLPNSSFVAVKRHYGSKLFERKFLLEIIIFERFRHRNIVPLLGFCTERKERILVYEYMSKGRLRDWLNRLENQATMLGWPIRLKIALGLARGLAGLHHSCNLQIVHLNISSESVLLDHNFEPKISDFGSTKLVNETGKKNQTKKDVYNFGIVLFELITGKKSTTDSFSSLIGSLVKFASNQSTRASDFCTLIDQSLLGQGFDGEISFLITVACDCIHTLPHRRPSMLHVYERIRILWEGYGSND